MIDSFHELYICILNILFGITSFFLYFGVTLLQRKKVKITTYILDILAIIIVGYLYLTFLNNNTINFHIYYIIFITIGYLLSYSIFKDKLYESYIVFFKLCNYLRKQLYIILKWSIEIIPISYLYKKTSNVYIYFKIKKTLKSMNKKISSKKNG